jgi:hypothetical protein
MVKCLNHSIAALVRGKVIVAFDSEVWIKRADEVLGKGRSLNQTGASETVQCATSMLTALYGPQSSQLRAFSAGCDAISKAKPQE